MKPLDIVQLDNGSVGMIKEGDESGCSITWFGGCENKCAWWDLGEQGLKVIDNLPSILCDGVRHPFSSKQDNPYKD